MERRSTLALPVVAILMALLVLAVPVGARVDVKVAFDKAFDFTKVKTWDWTTPGHGEVKMARTQTDDSEAMRKRVDPIIADALPKEMERRKLTRATSAPDVGVVYYLLLTVGSSAQTVGQFIPPALDWGLPLFPPATQSLKVMNEGSFVIDISSGGTVVWRGLAQAQIKMDESQDKREATLREAVRDLLRRFPPKN